MSSDVRIELCKKEGDIVNGGEDKKNVFTFYTGHKNQRMKKRSKLMCYLKINNLLSSLFMDG